MLLVLGMVLAGTAAGESPHEKLAPEDALQRDMAEAYHPKPAPSAAEVLSGGLDARFPASPIYPESLDWIEKGFAPDRLSNVPPPGVHPRVLMSPSDIEVFRHLLAMGDEAPPVFQSTYAELKKWSQDGDTKFVEHISPWLGPLSPTAAKALVALVEEDHEMGRSVVPLIMRRADIYLEWHEKWSNSATGWFDELPADLKEDGHIGSAILEHPDTEYPVRDVFKAHNGSWTHSSLLGLEYDYAHAFMTDRQRDHVRRAMASYTANKYISFMEVPNHFLINNHWAFAMNWWVASLCIEGEDGWDARIGDVGRRKIEAYITSMLSPSGMAFERAKPCLTPYGLLAATRRDRRLFQHPHLHAAVNNALNVLWWDDHKNGGEWRWDTDPGIGRLPISAMHHFYPDDPDIEFLWLSYTGGTSARDVHSNLDLALLYSTHISADDVQASIAKQAIPEKIVNSQELLWSDPLRGAVRMRTGWEKDSLVVRFENRTDYFSAGHERAEANVFWFSSHGVNWTPQDHWGRMTSNDSLWHNMLHIDGKAAPRWQPVPGFITDLQDGPAGTTVVGDATDPYNWRKQEKLFELWHPKIKAGYEYFARDNGWKLTRAYELPSHPMIRKFNEGFAHLEWGHWHGETVGPERYEQWNEVERVFRTLHIPRGERPYMLVIDDARKDDDAHRYDWLLNLHPEVKVVSNDGEDMILSLYDARLLLRVLKRNVGDKDLPLTFEKARVTVSAHGIEPEFKILLYPFAQGDPLPETRWLDDGKCLTISLPGQKDLYHFATSDGGRTVFAMDRNGRRAHALQGRPAKPEPADLALWYGKDSQGTAGHIRSMPSEARDYNFPFAGSLDVALAKVPAGGEIRYTVDGSEPGESSSLYRGPFTIDKTTVVKAKVIRPDWPLGEELGSSETRVIRYALQKPRPAVALADAEPGLVVELFEVFRHIYDDETGFFTGDKNMMPELDDRKPRLRQPVDGLDNPPELPSLLNPRAMATAFYRYTGYFNADQAGVYRFRLHSPGPVRVSVGGQDIIEANGPYYLSQRDRIGGVALEKGLHKMEIIFCDPVSWKNGKQQDGSPEQGPPLLAELSVAAPSATEYRPVKPAELMREAGSAQADR